MISQVLMLLIPHIEMKVHPTTKTPFNTNVTFPISTHRSAG
jgi:hypothetical protein